MLCADFHAAVTTNALVGIAHQAIGRPVQRAFFGKAAVAAVVLQAHVECHVLQFTIAVTRTACAVLIVI